MKRSIAIALGALIFAGPANSEMRPLETVIAQGGEETYPLIRCGALFLSVLEWAGEKSLGDATVQHTKAFLANVIDIATEMRTVNLGSGARDSVFRDIRNVSDAYLKRYEENYAKEGQAFGSDAMWDSDSAICNQLLGG